MMIAAACLLLLGLTTTVERYPGLTLHPEGDPGVLMSDDVDGDGDGDLVMIDGLDVSVFLSDGAGVSQQPSERFRLPPRSVFTDLGDLEGDGSRELLVLTPDGVAARHFGTDADAGFELVDELVSEDLFLFEIDESEVGWNEILLDLDGSGPEDAILPTSRGYLVFFRASQEGGFEPGGLIPVAPAGSFDLSVGSDLGSLRQTIEMPKLFALDLDGDGHNEIVTFDGRNVAAFRGSEGADPVWIRILDRNLYRDEESLEEEILASRNVRIENLDGGRDNCVIAVRSTEGELDFFSSAEGDPLGQRRTLRLEGWILPPRLVDLDGDTRLDLLVPTIDAVGYLRLMKIFVSRSVTMRYSIFRYRDEVRYGRVPDEVREITFPLDYETGASGMVVDNQMIYSFEGDFDGDGLRDFLVKSSSTELAVHRGTKEGSFSKQPDQKITITDMSDYFTVALRLWDLNRDGKTDILLNYYGRSDQPHLYRLHLSR